MLLVSTFIFLLCLPASADPIPLMVEDSWPPFAYRENKMAVGMSVDLVRAAFKKVGEDIELHQVPYLRCLALTRSGRFPGCFNSARSKEMASEFLFPREPLFKSKGLIIVLRSFSGKLLKVKDLENQMVVLPHEFPFGSEFDDNTRIKKVFVSSDLASMNMLKTGRVSFAAIDEYVYYYHQKKNPAFRDLFKVVLRMTEEPIYIHFSSKHPQARAIMKKFEEGLELLKLSSEYSGIIESWIGPTGLRRVQVSPILLYSRSPLK